MGVASTEVGCNGTGEFRDHDKMGANVVLFGTEDVKTWRREFGVVDLEGGEFSWWGGLCAADTGAACLHMAHDSWDLLFVVFVNQGGCEAWPGCIAAVVNGFHPCLFHRPTGGAAIKCDEIVLCFKAVGVESNSRFVPMAKF